MDQFNEHELMPNPSPRRHWRLIILLVGVIILGSYLYYLGTNEDTSPETQPTYATTAYQTSSSTLPTITGSSVSPSQSPQAAQAIKTIADAPTLVAKRSGNCRALAPSDWTILANNQSTGVDLLSGDKTFYAGWGIAAIDRGMQPYYGDLYGDPETSIAYLGKAIVDQFFGGAESLRFTSDAQEFDNYFVQRTFEAGNTKGLVYYRIYPTYGSNYVESVYFSVTRADQWEAGHSLAANVAASIRCTSQLRPSSSTGGTGSSTGTGTTDDGADGLSNSTYNKELGTEYVHSESTGENFLVGNEDYVENGPQGSGYYRQVGNDYEKLDEGRADY